VIIILLKRLGDIVIKENYCYNIRNDKNYCQIFASNILFGWQSGSISVMSNFLTPYKIVDNAFMNRVFEVGIGNILKHISSPKSIKSESLDNGNQYLVSNPIYKGIVQTNKYIPNIWGQNFAKSSYGGDTLVDEFGKSFIAFSLGMSLSFANGAMEKKINNIESKMNHTLTIYSAVVDHAYNNCVEGKSYSAKGSGAKYLNFQDTMLTSAGLMAAFHISDMAVNAYDYAIEIYKPAEEESDICEGDSLGELQSFALLSMGAITVVTLELYMGMPVESLRHAGQLFGTSIACAIGVTSIEIAYDYDFI
jgi:hypothetical protein